jgi:fido (protein-threonine AMPylation protein)
LRDRRRVRANIAAVIRGIAASSPSRVHPALETAKQWHRDIYSGVRVPVACYVGTFRGDHLGCPELERYGVMIGTAPGVDPGDVAAEAAVFEGRMQRGVAILDPLIAVRMPPQTADELRGVVNLAANAHGEWVRIHPFANGNGRTARLWANWVALRYGLPAFVRLKPRPAGAMYAAAAAASMRRDHTPTAVLFMDWLSDRLRGDRVP